MGKDAAMKLTECGKGGERVRLRALVRGALAAWLLGTALLGGCRTGSCPNAGTDWAAPSSTRLVRTELYMGMARQGQPDVSEQEWAEFLEQVVTPRFPRGITVLSGRGQWLQDGDVVKEPSKALVVFRAVNEGTERAIEEVRAEYIRRFDQDAVLRVDDEVVVRFR